MNILRILARVRTPEYITAINRFLKALQNMDEPWYLKFKTVPDWNNTSELDPEDWTVNISEYNISEHRRLYL